MSVWRSLETHGPGYNEHRRSTQAEPLHSERRSAATPDTARGPMRWDDQCLHLHAGPDSDGETLHFHRVKRFEFYYKICVQVPETLAYFQQKWKGETVARQ